MPARIGGNGNISVATGGDLTANSIFAFINNRNGGTIGSAANINFDIGGALSDSPAMQPLSFRIGMMVAVGERSVGTSV